MNDSREHRHIYVDRDRLIHFKAKVTLILCVFSSSDDGSNWRLLYSLLHPTTNHLNHLIRDILSFPGRSRQWCTHDSSLRAGLRKGSLVNQLSWEGPVQNYVIQTGISEQSDLRKGILKQGLKKTGIFIIIGWMCTLHFQHTFLFKTTCKVNLASDDPFNKTCSKLSSLWQKLRPHYSQSVKNVSNQFRPYNWIIKPCFFSIKQACDLLETKKRKIWPRPST